MSIGLQVLYLFILAIPIACISWTFTHEELFRELYEFFVRITKKNRYLLVRKFFFLLTCEYCFSHYVTILAIWFTDYHLLLSNWKGYIIAGFALVWIANIYMSLFYLIRIDIKKEKIEIKEKEKEKEQEHKEEKNVAQPTGKIP